MPDGRGAAQVAYDTTNHELVMFGGDGPYGPTADTWIWKNGRWSWVQTDMAPSDRALGAFIYDPARHVSLLFGGAPSGAWVDRPLNDTWAFDGSRWTQLAPVNSPPPRSAAAVTFDTRRNVIVMYGGYAGLGNFLNDVWTWDGTNWTQQASSLPAPVFPLGFTSRPSDGAMLLVGQETTGGGIGNQLQTWAFANGSWTQTSAGNTPPCIDHYGGSAEYPHHGTLVFFGGYCPNTTVVWDGSSWSSSTPNPSPMARGNEAGRPAMTYDPEAATVLLFGGVGNGTYFNDLWSWNGSAWTNLG